MYCHFVEKLDFPWPLVWCFIIFLLTCGYFGPHPYDSLFSSKMSIFFEKIVRKLNRLASILMSVFITNLLNVWGKKYSIPIISCSLWLVFCCRYIIEPVYGVCRSWDNLYDRQKLYQMRWSQLGEININ